MKALTTAATLVLGTLVANSAFAQVPTPPTPPPNPVADPTLIPVATPGASVPLPPGFDCSTSPAAAAQFKLGHDNAYLSLWSAWLGSSQDRNAIGTFISTAGTMANMNLNAGLAALNPSIGFQNELGCRFAGGLEGVVTAGNDVLTAVVASCSAHGAYVAELMTPIACNYAGTFPAAPPLPLLTRNSGPCSAAHDPMCTTTYNALAASETLPSGLSCSTLVSSGNALFESFRWNDCTFSGYY